MDKEYRYAEFLPKIDEQKKPQKLEEPKQHLEIKVVSEEDPLLQSVVGDRYRIENLLGKGATSNVYSAREIATDNVVAIKVLHKYLTSDTGVVRRFLEEAENATILHHANIARVSHAGQIQTGQPYFIVEYVPGITLREYLQQSGGNVAPAKALNIFIQLCAALTAAHQVGIVHRDIKPENIMIVSRPGMIDFVKVLDFGVAKIIQNQSETHFKVTQTGETMGSILYMSPEQCLDSDVDTRSDIYALGCLMYECLVGKPPLCGRTAFLTMNQHLSDTPISFAKVRPDLHFAPALEQTIFKSMAKDRAKRQQTAADLQDHLIAIQNGLVAPVAPITNVAKTATVTIKVAAAAPTARLVTSNATAPKVKVHLPLQTDKPSNVVLAVQMLWTVWGLEISKALLLVWCSVEVQARSAWMMPATPILLIGLFVYLLCLIAGNLIQNVAKGNDSARALTSICWVAISFLYSVNILLSPPGYAHQWYNNFIVAIIAIQMPVSIAAVTLLYSKSANAWFKKS